MTSSSAVKMGDLKLQISIFKHQRNFKPQASSLKLQSAPSQAAAAVPSPAGCAGSSGHKGRTIGRRWDKGPRPAIDRFRRGASASAAEWFLECGDRSPLWNAPTCRRVRKRGHALHLTRISCGSSADWQSAVSPAGSRQGVGNWGGLEISKSPYETVQVFRPSG